MSSLFDHPSQKAVQNLNVSSALRTGADSPQGHDMPVGAPDWWPRNVPAAPSRRGLRAPAKPAPQAPGTSSPAWSPMAGEPAPETWDCKICGTPAQRLFTVAHGEHKIVEASVLPEDYERPYYRCSRCGFFFHPAFESLPDKEREELVHSGMGDALHLQLNRGRRELIMVNNFRIMHAMQGSPKVLVFGCGSGLSFNYMLASGFDAYASDLAIHFKRASKTFADYGFRQDLLPEMLHRFRSLEDIPARSLDIITMTEVFEHLMDPVDMMGQLVRKLKPGGLVIGTTGWVDKVREKLNDWWYIKCLTHTTFLSSEGFRRLSQAVGCMGTLYPASPLLLGDSNMSETQCIFTLQRPS